MIINIRLKIGLTVCIFFLMLGNFLVTPTAVYASNESQVSKNSIIKNQTSEEPIPPTRNIRKVAAAAPVIWVVTFVMIYVLEQSRIESFLGIKPIVTKNLKPREYGFFKGDTVQGMERYLEEEKELLGADDYIVDEIKENLKEDSFVPLTQLPLEYFLEDDERLLDSDDERECARIAKERGLVYDKQKDCYVDPKTGTKYIPRHCLRHLDKRAISSKEAADTISKDNKCHSKRYPDNYSYFDDATRTAVFVDIATEQVTSGIRFGQSANSLKKYNKLKKNECGWG